MLTMEEAFEKSLTTFSEGEIVNGTVIETRGREIIVDIGYKSEGHVALNEFDEDNQRVGTRLNTHRGARRPRRSGAPEPRRAGSEELGQDRSLCEETKVIEGRIKQP